MISTLFENNRDFWNVFGNLLGDHLLTEEDANNLQLGQIGRRTYSARYFADCDEIFVDISCYRITKIDYSTNTFTTEYDPDSATEEVYKNPKDFIDKYWFCLRSLVLKYDTSLLAYVDEPELTIEDGKWMYSSFAVGASTYSIEYRIGSGIFGMKVSRKNDDGTLDEYYYNFDEFGLVEDQEEGK